MGTPEDVAAEKYFAPPEVRLCEVCKHPAVGFGRLPHEARYLRVCEEHKDEVDDFQPWAERRRE